MHGWFWSTMSYVKICSPGMKLYHRENHTHLSLGEIGELLPSNKPDQLGLVKCSISICKSYFQWRFTETTSTDVYFQWTASPKRQSADTVLFSMILAVNQWFFPKGQKIASKKSVFHFLPTRRLYLSLLILPQSKPFSLVDTAECMVSYIIYRCQYQTVPEILSGLHRHGPHTVCKKLSCLYVSCFFSVFQFWT